MTDVQRDSHGSSRARHISWLTIVLGLITIGTFLAISSPGVRYVTPLGTIGWGGYSSEGTTMAVPPTTAGAPMVDTGALNGSVQGGMMRPDIYPYPYPTTVPVTDTREFMKVYYSATMLTRSVQSLTQRAETTIRGYDGRIDAESSSPEYGYVSFSIPQSKYIAFRAEFESLVGSRFLTLNISSQNLLPQKVSIEEQQKQADAALADFKTARQKIISVHATSIQSLQTKIDADEAQLATLRAGTLTPQVLLQIQTVSDYWTALKQQLTDENKSYTVQLSNADANIKYAQNWQKAVQTQDQTLFDNIATVTGTVSIQWISLWDVALLYLPGYWIPAIFAMLTVLSFFRDRRRTTAS